MGRGGRREGEIDEWKRERESSRKMCERTGIVDRRRMDRCCHDSLLSDEGDRMYHSSVPDS